MASQTPTTGSSAERVQDSDEVNEPQTQSKDVINAGWKVMGGTFYDFCFDYLLDKSTSWSHQAWTHVYKDDHFVCTMPPTANDYDRWTKIDASIRDICIANGWGVQEIKVNVSFDTIFITAQNRPLLEALWRTPPLCGSQRLRLVCRALPWDEVTVWRTHPGASMTMQEVELGCRSMSVGDNKPIGIIAKFCKNEEKQDRTEPTGEVLVFCSKVAPNYTPKFYGQDLVKQQYGPTADPPRHVPHVWGSTFEIIGPRCRS
ncbi:uncharacterized protein SRS1_13417 [Sporisorium reilianum f. sp. reilianum]|uniref:Uncharacterized protein n=1 Tax=Sporisorium reilianum f. sp. reilianum TaxID=72559 RepID=A0A2N8UE30_9BASI|nr:uncharacterized protein SRS1_13417 [Sporisorium reilianum f. sp. reilianum]